MFYFTRAKDESKYKGMPLARGLGGFFICPSNNGFLQQYNLSLRGKNTWKRIHIHYFIILALSYHRILLLIFLGFNRFANIDDYICLYIDIMIKTNMWTSRSRESSRYNQLFININLLKEKRSLISWGRDWCSS